MKKYYVNGNAQRNGDHEVHEENCGYLPQPQHRIYLGEFTHCVPAVSAAKLHYQQVNGCSTCCAACHTQ